MQARIVLGGLAVALLAFSLAAGAAPDAAPADPAKEKALKFARLRESARMQEIGEWIQRSHPDQRAILAKVYEPIIQGNQRDYPENVRAANFYLSKAQEAAKDKDRKAYAETYSSLAKAYTDLAKQNYIILKAMENYEMKPIQDALAAIPRIEERITEQARRAPKRSWFLPSELAEDEQPAQVQQQAAPAAGAAKPAAPATTTKPPTAAQPSTTHP